jgi:hypothetical protein
MAFTKSVSKWFDKEMLRAPDLGYKEGKESFKNERKDFTSLTNKFISLTKLTNVWKHHISDFMLLTSNS